MPTKYHAIKTDGYDSRKEARRAAELKLLLKAGNITDLTEQPRFLLQEGFTYRGKSVRRIEYVADFMYLQDGKTVVEDVKGMQTDVYKIKKKLFLKKYPTIDFREV